MQVKWTRISGEANSRKNTHGLDRGEVDALETRPTQDEKKNLVAFLRAL
jgi:hypothetical protein